MVLVNGFPLFLHVNFVELEIALTFYKSDHLGRGVENDYNSRVSLATCVCPPQALALQALPYQTDYLLLFLVFLLLFLPILLLLVLLLRRLPATLRLCAQNNTLLKHAPYVQKSTPWTILLQKPSKSYLRKNGGLVTYLSVLRDSSFDESQYAPVLEVIVRP